MAENAVRNRTTRVADARAKLEQDVDVWVSSANEDGCGYLVPLSYYWDGRTLTMAAHPRSPTALNLHRSGWARVALGPTRDVLIIEGSVEIFPASADEVLAALHARATGFDTRAENEDYCFMRLTPESIQTWRNAAELRGRDVMRNGVWLE